jgi:hypothetical protein
MLEKVHLSAVLNFNKKYQLAMVHNDGYETFGYESNRGNISDLIDLDGSSGRISGTMSGMKGFVNKRFVYCKVARSGNIDYAVKFTDDNSDKLIIAITSQSTINDNYLEAQVIIDTFDYNMDWRNG